MVVLRHYCIGERKTMIVPTSASHCVPLKEAQPWCRLSRVDDPRLRSNNFSDKARGHSRNTRHPLHKVQRNALRLQHRPRWSLDTGQRITAFEMLPVCNRESS